MTSKGRTLHAYFVKFWRPLISAKYFLIDEVSVSILQRLMDDFEEYSHKLVDPVTPDRYIRDLPLDDLKGMLTARRGQLCARLELVEDRS